MVVKRQGLSKKTRFEVLKRDLFTCQYCGSHPPNVILECDHIVPVADGGKNSMDNLVTACFDCNRGKAANSLLVVPQSLSDKAAIIAEREEQLRGYSGVLEARRQRLDDETWRVLAIISPGKDSVPREYFNSIRMFIEKLGVHEVIDAMEIALASSASSRNMFRYFCGVCWNKVRKMEGVL